MTFMKSIKEAQFIHALYKASRGNTQYLPFKRIGLCYNAALIDYSYRDTFKKIVPSWKHYSGCSAYPVPADTGNNNQKAAYKAYNTHRDNLYNPKHPYGEMRCDLCKYFADHLLSKANKITKAALWVFNKVLW